MALLFDASGEFVSHGTGMPNPGNNWTKIFWLEMVTPGNTGYLNWMRTNGANQVTMFWNAGTLEVVVGRSGTNDLLTGAGSGLNSAGFHFLVVTYDNAAAPNRIKVYTGTPLAAAALDGQGGNGSGSVGNPSGAAYIVGNNATPSNNFPGAVSYHAHHPVTLNLQQILSMQQRIRRRASTDLLTLYGLNDAGTQPDWSGNGRNGTVTGATVYRNAPVRFALQQGRAPLSFPPAVVCHPPDGDVLVTGWEDEVGATSGLFDSLADELDSTYVTTQ